MKEHDAEVESVLVELRQRLRLTNAGRSTVDVKDARRDALARIEASAAVAGRAWNRLPPVMSDRRGWRGRLEILLKRWLKRATNWFTWEQINANAATADALRAAHALLSEQVERESRLEARINALEDELAELRRLRAHL